jgi:hypothetical protein
MPSLGSMKIKVKIAHFDGFLCFNKESMKIPIMMWSMHKIEICENKMKIKRFPFLFFSYHVKLNRAHSWTDATHDHLEHGFRLKSKQQKQNCLSYDL